MKTSVGDYEIIREIGSDLLGTLYLAQHRYLKRLFTLKALPPEFAEDAQFIARFEEEMGRSGLLDHPNIVRMHHATCIDGTFFIVSETVGDHQERMDLETFLQSSDLSEEEVYTIALQIASALDYAHAPSSDRPAVIHGWLCLSNVLIYRNNLKNRNFGKEAPQNFDPERATIAERQGASEDRNSEVKPTQPKTDSSSCFGTDKKSDESIVYLDNFGLMRIVGAGAMLSRMFHHLSLSVGKQAEHRSYYLDFAFLAPEQREALSEGDFRSDTYAFGVIIYYMLMKKIPKGSTLPSVRFPHLYYNWDLLLSHCMQQEKEKRPGCLTEAIQDLLQPKTILPSLIKEIQKTKIPPEKEGLKPILRPGELERPEFIADPASVFIIDPVVGHYQPRQVEVLPTEPILTEMVVIRGGHYHRGSGQGGRDEIPRHLVSLSSFAMDIHPVTNEQFVRFLEAMGGEKDLNNNDIIRLRESRIKRSAGRVNIESGYAKHPVVGVSWYGALAYAKWMGKRLPTEAEWEIAAMGGFEENAYPYGKEIEKSQANFFSSDTTIVMSYPPNGYGLFDMAGNVYEWCQDWYEFHYYDTSIQEPQDPKGPLQGNYRVLRGGCWKSLKDDLRCSHRHRNNPGTMNGTYGFRCAADVA